MVHDLGWLEEAEEEVDNDSQNKGDAEKCWAQAVIKVPLTSSTNCLRTPVVRHKGI